MTAARATLGWALGASAIVHAAVVIYPMTGGGELSRPLPGVALVQPVSLSVKMEQFPAPLTTEMPSPLALPAGQMLAFMPLPASMRELPPLEMPGMGGGMRGELSADGRILAASERLDGVADRQSHEFPIEVDTPVRLNGRAVARVPGVGLPDDPEATVTVWVLVGWNGTVEEAQIIDGPPEFTEAVIAAVKGASFAPATNNLRALRYPAVLEFRFATSPNPGEVLTARSN